MFWVRKWTPFRCANERGSFYMAFTVRWDFRWTRLAVHFAWHLQCAGTFNASRRAGPSETGVRSTSGGVPSVSKSSLVITSLRVLDFFEMSHMRGESQHIPKHQRSSENEVKSMMFCPVGRHGTVIMSPHQSKPSRLFMTLLHGSWNRYTDNIRRKCVNDSPVQGDMTSTWH